MLSNQNLTALFKRGKKVPTGEHGGYSGTYTVDSKPAIGCYSRIGAAGKDEDNIRAGALPHYNTLQGHGQQEQAIQLTFEILQEAFGESGVGSTGCFAAITKTNDNSANQATLTIKTANVGDSSAYYVKVNTDFYPPVAEIKRLNEWHNPKEEKENKRLTEAGFAGNIDGQGRLNGLAVSGGFGDNGQEESGFSHVPTLTTDQVNLEATESGFLIIASDGLSDSFADENAILNALMSIPGFTSATPPSPEEIAYQLGEKAKTNWSIQNPGKEKELDDTSIIVISTDQIPESTMVSGFVADGHAGKSVSYNVGGFLYYVLEKVSQAMSRGNAASAKPLIIAEIKKMAAFKRIYQALYDGQSGLKSKNYLEEVKENNIDITSEYLEQYAIDHPGSRRAEAWKLANEHYNDKIPFIENAALFEKIYTYSFKNSHWGIFGGRSKLFSTPMESSETTCCSTLITSLARSFSTLFRTSRVESEFKANKDKLTIPKSSDPRQQYHDKHKKGLIELHQEENPDNRTARIVRGFSKRL